MRFSGKSSGYFIEIGEYSTLVAKTSSLDAPLVNGRGHVRVGDSSWPVIADEDFAAGSKVEVIAVGGITLRIRPPVR